MMFSDARQLVYYTHLRRLRHVGGKGEIDTDDLAADGAAGKRLSVPLWTLFAPVAVALALILVLSQRGDGRLHMWVLDVGEGDAILLLTPRGHTVLVDGGPGVTPLTEGIGKHLPFWQHNIDVVVVTQPQQENMMGLVDLLGRYDVGEVVQSDFTGTGSLQDALSGKLSEMGTPLHYVTRGDEIGFADEPDVTLKVLNPGKDDILKGDKSTLENNRSVVLAVKYGKIRMLLAGDVEEAGEANILRVSGDEVASQVLKVAAHGSGNASSSRFVQAVGPQVSVISVGEGNKGGYPSIDALNRLHDAGSQVYRTDQDGTVEVIAEKDRFWVKSDK